MTKTKQASLFATGNDTRMQASAVQGNFFDDGTVSLPVAKVKDGPVTCLGQEFSNDAERREYFTELLRQKLQDPDFRSIEGFPHGTDEAILALSDPPYYCACPNPWLGDFVAQWEGEKPVKEEGYHYHREPFAADVSEGKNDPIYNAHSYHTKVPHKAIMRYILHYTEPGDIVFDGFCGTGMTGVAAQMCGDRDVVSSLGYKVDADGTISQEEINEAGKTVWVPFSKLGTRKAILNDLSPAATFIAYNYNTPVDVVAFEKEAKRILDEVEQECGWMYETTHTDEHGNKSIGKINCTVWSDVFICPECAGEVVFWNAAVDKKAGKVLDAFPCPHCGANLAKRTMDRAWKTFYDKAISQPVKQAKQIPVLISYSVGNKRFEKTPDVDDVALIQKIENMDIPYWFPTDRLMKGKETRRNDPIGITHIHHFYTKRNLLAMASLTKYQKTSAEKFIFTGIACRSTQMNRIHLKNFFFGGGGWNAGYLKGTLYISSLPIESSIFEQYNDRLCSIRRAFSLLHSYKESAMSTASSIMNDCNTNSLDYIFIDPPFGANLNYSELNFLWESWLKVQTNNKTEAIENSVQKKGPAEYREIMTACFKEAYRLLKPGRWMTVEFSNTKASVWNSIQTSLMDAGFIVANVSALDKKQGSFKAVTTPTAVKQDLVISAYKPNGGFEDRFTHEAEQEQGIWDFVRTHLGYLPVLKYHDGALQVIPERDPRILYDQLVAYYVRKGYMIPISSQEFQQGLVQRFIERDGMFFLPEQAAKYDRRKTIAGTHMVQQALFVKDESSAIAWLRQLLKDKPQTFADMNPLFMQQLGGWSKNEIQLDLRVLLEQNFLCYDGKGLVPEQIHAYLSTNWKDMRNLEKDNPSLVAKALDRWYLPDPNKASDMEKLRERALLKEFELYKEATKKLKVFRLEAVHAGFKKAWQSRDYATIVAVAQHIPSAILEEDDKLLMWYDVAQTRLGM